MRVNYFTLLILFGVLSANGQIRPKKELPSLEKSCVKGAIRYSVAIQKKGFDIKRKYARKIDRLVYKPVFELLCSGQIENLPTKGLDRDSEGSVQHNYWEPLFINMESLDGLYGLRSFGAVSALMRCGHFHEIFVISNKRYYSFSRDTIANMKVIATKLKNSFSQEEIQRMQHDYNRRAYCLDFTFLPPEIIKRGKKVLFDLHKI